MVLNIDVKFLMKRKHRIKASWTRNGSFILVMTGTSYWWGWKVSPRLNLSLATFLPGLLGWWFCAGTVQCQNAIPIDPKFASQWVCQQFSPLASRSKLFKTSNQSVQTFPDFQTWLVWLLTFQLWQARHVFMNVGERRCKYIQNLK